MRARPVSTPKNYLLGLLTIIFAFNFTDRVALGIVAQNIKGDLDLSDSQVGFLSGIAFALFYALMGMPIARWADRGNRVAIVSISTALWSVAVALCGMASTFVQLILIRIVVGVGEAGCVPPAHSLIADFFARAERPRAIAMYMQGASASLVIGYFAAGWLNQLYGWRAMFVLIGLPGVLMAALAWFTLREPRVGNPDRLAATAPAHMMDVCVALWRLRTFRHVLFAFSLICFFGYGTLQWAPAYFVRGFGLKTGELGTWFAAIFGLSGLIGTYWGGEWAARSARNNEQRQLNGMALMTCLSGVFWACAFLPAISPNRYWAFGWLALSNCVSMAINGPTFAALQTMVPAPMRAVAVALVFLFINLIGLGCGPWAVGALSDALRPWVGEESLRYAMLMFSPTALWGAWHLWRAGQTVFVDLGSGQKERVARGAASEERGSCEFAGGDNAN